jgi:hypothetical protein
MISAIRKEKNMKNYSTFNENVITVRCLLSLIDIIIN